MPKLPKDFATLVYVHLGLLAAAFGAAWFVHTQSTALPVDDEWDLLREWLQADSAGSFVWRHHNEHRFPLSKIIWAAVLKLTGYKLAAPIYLSLALLIATALLLLWTARGLRGRSHPVDIVFPALLLHFGHGYNLQMGYQVGFVLFAYCLAGWIWCAGRLAQRGGTGWAFGSTVYAALLIPCGGFGLVFTPIVGFWLLYLARHARTQGKAAFALYCVALAAAAVIYSLWIFATMPKAMAEGTNPFAKPGEFLTVVVGYLASAVGCWPVREETEPWYIVAVAVPIAVAYSVAMQALARKLDGPDPRRIAHIALILVMVGSVLVGAAAAKARGESLAERFTTPSCVGLAAALLALVGSGPLRLSRPVSALLGSLALLLSAGMLYANYGPGLNLAFRTRDGAHNITLDLRAGESPLLIGGRHGGTPGVLVGESMAGDLESYRIAGIPPFDRMAADPAYRTHALPPLPHMDWRIPEADFFAGKPVPEARLADPPVGTLGMRIRVTTLKFCGNHRLILRWIDAATGAAHESYAHPHYHSGLAIHLVFHLTGTPTRVRLMAGSAIEGLKIDEPEWLIGEGSH